MRDRRDGRSRAGARGVGRGFGRRSSESTGPSYRLSGATGSRGRVPNVRLTGSGRFSKGGLFGHSALAGRTSPSTILVGRGDIPQFRDKSARNGGWSIPSLSGRPQAAATPRVFLLAVAVAVIALVVAVVLAVRSCGAA